MANILIVEDDMDIAQGLAEFLEIKGHELDFAYTGKQAQTMLAEANYHLVLLDINLPFVDGYEICKGISGNSLGQHLAKLPVIMMSSRSDEQDILQGFKSGAWDYLKKPFSFSELAARIDISLAKSTINPLPNNTLEFKELALDKTTQTLHYQTKELQLHNVGSDILELLISQAPMVVKTLTFHQQIWAEDTPDSDPLRSHIYKLRKLLTTTFNQPFITTVKGVGYKLTVMDDTNDLC